MILKKQNFARIGTFLVSLSLLGFSLAVEAETMRQYQLQKQGAGYQLQLTSAPIPEITADQILVKVHATSLNRRADAGQEPWLPDLS